MNENDTVPLVLINALKFQESACPIMADMTKFSIDFILAIIYSKLIKLYDVLPIRDEFTFEIAKGKQ